MGLICVVGMIAALGPAGAAADGPSARAPSPMVRTDGPPRMAKPQPAPGRDPIIRAPGVESRTYRRGDRAKPDLPPPTPTVRRPALPPPVIAAPAPVISPTVPVVSPPDAGAARPAPAPSPFFVPISPAPSGATPPLGTASGGPAGGDQSRPNTDGRRHRWGTGDATSPRLRGEGREARAARRDARKKPVPDDRPTDPPIAGDRPTATGPSGARPTLASAAAKSTEAAAASVAPIALPRPGAPSAAMLGLTTREMVVNQLVAIVPVNRAGDLVNDYGLAIDDEATIRSLGVRLVTFTVLRPRGLGDIIDLMGLDSRVQGAQPNFRYRTLAGAAAGVYPQNRMRIEPALGVASGAGVTVALIDTKVAELSSLAGHVTERLSIIQNGGRGRHGTALAGLIADVAPAARLLSIEAFADDPGDPDTGVSTTLSLARAIDAAIDRKADIINLSVAGPRDPLIGRLVRQALGRGIVVVAAAGNDGPDAPPRYPAAYDGVVAVTATDARDLPYAAAAQGAHVAVAAPGVDVRATVSEGVVGYVTGTSVAAAHVAGVVALLRERAPKLGSADAGRLLKETASPLPQGPGMVDAFAALSRATAFAGR